MQSVEFIAAPPDGNFPQTGRVCRDAAARNDPIQQFAQRPQGLLSTEANPGPDASLFLQRRFLPMWVALSFGTFADNTLRNALLIGIPAGLVTVPFFDDPDNAMPYIGALLPLAILLFSSVSGQLADKYETSMMFRRTKFMEIILMSVAGLAFLTGNGMLAIAMLFAMGAQSAFFSPVRVGAMPKYLHTDELLRGNGLCNAGLFTFILLGYMAGGLKIVQENGGLLVAFALVAAALVGWTAALQTPFAAANDPDLKLSFNGAAQTLAMFRYVFRSPGVAPPLIGVGVFYFLSTAVTVAVPLYGRDSLHSEPVVWTALNGLFAIGAMIGAVAAASLAKGRSGLGFSAGAIIGAGIMSLAVVAATPFAAGTPDDPLTLGGLFTSPAGVVLVACLVATSALGGVYIAPLQAAMQRRAPALVRARILAAGIFANAAFAIPGSLSILLITSNNVDPVIAFAGVAVAMLLIGAIMIFRWRTHPSGLYDDMG